MKHPKYMIQRRHPLDEGMRINLKKSVTKHIAEILFGIELIAKTYGIRKITGSEEQVLPMACGILVMPFLMLIIALCYDRKKMQVQYDEKE